MRPVYHLEIILPASGSRLRDEHHIAQFYARKGEPAIPGHIRSGKISVQGNDLVIKPLRNGLRHPSVIGPGVYPLRRAFLHEAGCGPFGIGAEHCPAALDQFRQGVRGGRQAGDIISGIPQCYKKIVQRRHYFHSCCSKGILSGTLVVEYRYLLPALGLALQFQIPVDCPGKFFKTLRNGLQTPEPVSGLIVSEKHERPDRPVYLWCHYALGQEASGHAHVVFLPVGDESIGIQGREQGNIVFFQEFHHPVPESAVRHVDYGRRGYRIQLAAAEHRYGAAYGIDHVPGGLKGCNQVGRISHLPRNDNARGTVLPETVVLQPAVICRDGTESLLVPVLVFQGRMVDVLHGIFFCRGRFRSRNPFTVYAAADIQKHVPVIVRTSV